MADAPSVPSSYESFYKNVYPNATDNDVKFDYWQFSKETSAKEGSFDPDDYFNNWVQYLGFIDVYGYHQLGNNIVEGIKNKLSPDELFQLSSDSLQVVYQLFDRMATMLSTITPIVVAYSETSENLSRTEEGYTDTVQKVLHDYDSASTEVRINKSSAVTTLSANRNAAEENFKQWSQGIGSVTDSREQQLSEFERMLDILGSIIQDVFKP
ncbi:MAG: hypothetical protein ACQEP8_00430 [Chlamydiota bacterium]